MIKKMLVIAAMLVSVVAINGGVASAQVAQDDKVTICHATNSVQNPYTRPSVDADAADGDTQNDKGQGDHSEHTGPVATSPEVAQDLKNNKQDWGDIIPPHHNYAGLNWTAEGQAIYNNNCEYVEPNFDQPLVTFDISCPTVAGGKVVVTLTNDGNADGSATVNGQVVNVPANSNVTLEFNLGENIEIVIERQTVYDETPVCVGGRGGNDPQTPASTATAPQVDAPKAGVKAGNGATAALAAVVLASVASIALGVRRLLNR